MPDLVLKAVGAVEEEIQHLVDPPHPLGRPDLLQRRRLHILDDPQEAQQEVTGGLLRQARLTLI